LLTEMLKMELKDYIIIGSGCTGAMAAETLCGNGKSVLMIDTGLEKEIITNSNDNFIAKRLNDNNQSKFFLGDELEALGESTHPNIPQQTAQRVFMSALTDQFLSIESKSFFPVESLALGGLGNGWGLGSYAFSNEELKLCQLPVDGMNNAYKTIAERIGISGEQDDDASVYCHNKIFETQPSIQLNPSAESLYNKYKNKSKQFIQQGISMGRPSMALLTENVEDRKAYGYKDLDFYANEGNSAYRPYITIKKLIAKGTLEYEKGWLAVSFNEANNVTTVECLNIHTLEKKQFNARKLVLCAGTLGTSRIVMRSMQGLDKLPVLCNAYTYMPMVYLPFIGKQHTGELCGLAQLAMFYDMNRDHSNVAMASVYNYRSLLNFRILKQMPLNHADGRKFLQLLIPSLFIAGIFHPASYQSQNYIQLKPSSSPTGDSLFTQYTYTAEEEKTIKHTEKIYASAFFKLRCMVLKKMRTTTGGSIHYAGSLPFSSTEKPFHISPDGKLYGTNNVYVADGSGFTYLPGKGLTLSLMAYAHLTASKLLKDE
jgi:hypothetical protein